MRWAVLLVAVAGCVVYEPYPSYYTTRVYEEPTPTYTVRYKQPPPPPQQENTTIIIKEEPRLVRVSETHIYWAPYPQYDIYFVDGVWYCYYSGCWFYGYSWRGPWRRIYYLPDAFWYVPASHPRHNIIVRYLPPRRVERSSYPRYSTTRRSYPPTRTIRATPPPRPSHPSRSTSPKRIIRSPSPKPAASSPKSPSPTRLTPTKTETPTRRTVRTPSPKPAQSRKTTTERRTTRPRQPQKERSREDRSPTKRSKSDRRIKR